MDLITTSLPLSQEWYDHLYDAIIGTSTGCCIRLRSFQFQYVKTITHNNIYQKLEPEIIAEISLPPKTLSYNET